MPQRVVSRFRRECEDFGIERQNPIAGRFQIEAAEPETGI
jgi:hypothetical protein